jgi:hypothetical protein
MREGERRAGEVFKMSEGAGRRQAAGWKIKIKPRARSHPAARTTKTVISGC